MNHIRLAWTIALLLPTLIAWLPQSLPAQSDPAIETSIAAMTVRRELVIIGSTTSYTTARRRAIEASRQLAIPLDLRALTQHRKHGLTFSRNDCEEEGLTS